jgi:PIN domain nuclease of toxin-antitoxin system
MDPGNEVFLSAVSAWEISVKHGLGRLVLPEEPEVYVPRMREAHGIQALQLDEVSALHLMRLPALHPDPFDRMLVCQALVHGMALLTPDEEIKQYPIRCAW